MHRVIQIDICVCIQSLEVKPILSFSNTSADTFSVVLYFPSLLCLPIVYSTFVEAEEWIFDNLVIHQVSLHHRTLRYGSQDHQLLPRTCFKGPPFIDVCLAIPSARAGSRSQSGQGDSRILQFL